MENGNHRFVWKAIKYYRKQGGDIVNTPSFIIGLENKTTKGVIPHPISHFLFKNYHRNSGSINTELTVAQIIVPFLNFILDKVNQGLTEYTEVQGLADLREKHANAYLQYCVDEKSNKNKTLEMKENFLAKFYKYLWDEKVLKHKPKFKLVSVRTGKEVRKVYKIDFTYKKTDETLLRERVKRKDIVPQDHESNENRTFIRLQYIREILYVAKHETPDIAFGLALQIFGGLRKGEVVNMTRTALKSQNGQKYGVEGLVLLVRDRQNELFTRFSDVSTIQVKNPRDQSCLIDPILNYLYKHHVETVLKKIKKPIHPNALFYDTEGSPMSADTYDKRFLKLKNTYLGMLLGTPGRYQDYLDFSQTKWRSHIGRGAFTNMCLDAGFNEKQTAVLRGDRSTQSMESYFDIITATYNIRKALSLLSPDELDNITGLNMPFNHKMWKDVQEFGKGLRQK
ncbi:hypothetical protein [Alkalibacterium gilvum]|uniref:Phage integrase family protein n=1 Tax=Alkalibacterium gilvum TaxID=1130080 RepID=A0A1H6VH52_9LACT|nr:hypothetical protein [Alkalibacterium gilvum]SEJ00030.1 hypothetical protein SAMN04488113_1463 [Alkalibacterium gilvum]